ncbi:MAG: hypothetical protein M3P18_21400 [Actinomycetota bacterium]|nr:hypothetical protein [Actinomycetota bacterium]
MIKETAIFLLPPPEPELELPQAAAKLTAASAATRGAARRTKVRGRVERTMYLPLCLFTSA